MRPIRHLAIVTDEYERRALLLEYLRLPTTLRLDSTPDEEASIMSRQDRLRTRIEELSR